MLFQIWYVLIVGAVLSAAGGWLLDRLVRATGHAAITNFDLAGFFLSARGLAFLALLVGIGRVYSWQSGAACCCWPPPIRRRPWTRPTRWGVRCAAAPPDLAGLVVFHRLCRRAGATGRLAALIAWWLLGSQDINYYLYHQPREWWLAVAGGAVLALGYAAIALVLWFRLLFATHLVLFHRESPRMAMAKSWSMTRGRMLPLAVVLGGWWLVVALVAAACSALIGFIAALALARRAPCRSLARHHSRRRRSDLVDRSRCRHPEHVWRSHPGPPVLSGMRRNSARRVRRPQRHACELRTPRGRLPP